MKAISTSRLRDNLLKALAVTAVAAVPGAAFAPAAFAAPSSDPTDLSIPSGCDLELSGGSGTYTDPFQIRNERQLAELNDCGTDGDYLYYELENDIELVSDNSKYWNNDDYGWTPIGYSSEGDAWTGNFNGNGHTISGLRISSYGMWWWGDQAGFFGTVDGATIKNLTVEGQIDTDGYDQVGGLVGESDGDTHITNVHTNVDIYDDNGDSDDIGGIIGSAYGATVSNSTSSGNVISDGGSDIGGIAGYAEYFSLYKVSSSSQVNSVDNESDDNDSVGGILGYGDYGTINKATFTGSATGYYYVGGIVGYADAVSVNGSTVTEDALVQAESGNDAYDIGGIAGYFQYGAADDNTFAGELDALQDSNEIYQSGGLVGYLYEGSVSNSTVTADAQLNFAGDGDSSYYLGGLVGYGDYASISSSSNEADVDVSDAEYVGGILGYGQDGTGISGSINHGDVHVWTDSNADYFVGGVVGYLEDGGSITASANKGDVTFEGDTYTYDVGGLAGYATEASITDSYNLGEIQGNEYVGGLIGWADSETDINTSYNAGSVAAWDDYQDGIANGDWADSSSNVVLDTDVSAGSDTNVNQLSTSDVQDASVLAGLGWSIDEADATWAIDADFNDGYPYLAYEYTPGSAPVADVTFAAVRFSTKKSTDLSANAQAYLTLVAEQIQSDPYDRVEVNGYTNRHTRKSVARARTAAVVAFLEDAGVSVMIDVHNNISGPGHVRNTVVVSALG